MSSYTRQVGKSVSSRMVGGKVSKSWVPEVFSTRETDLSRMKGSKDGVRLSREFKVTVIGVLGRINE